jgi:O-antigen ligase
MNFSACVLLGVFLYAKGFLVYFIAANAVRNDEDVLLIIKTFLIACILVSIVYVPQNIARMGVGRGDEIIFRAKGIIGSPSVMATFLSSVSLIALSVKFAKTRSQLKNLALLAFFAGIPALILTFCRAPWMNFSACVLLGVLYGFKKGWLRGRNIVGFLGAAGIAVALLWPMISWRLSADHSAGLDERMNLMRIAWNMIKENPIIGIGINTYGDRYRAYIPGELAHTWAYAVHNQYLLVWAETGTLGFGIFISFLLGVVKKGIRCVRSKNDLLAPLSLGFLLGFMTILLDMFWGIYASEPATSHIWFFAGTIVGMNGLVSPQVRRVNA